MKVFARSAGHAAGGLLCLALAVEACGQALPTARTPAEVPQASELSPRTERPLTDVGALPARREPAPVPRELGKPEDELTLDVAGYDLPADAPATLREALPRLTAAYVGKGKGYEDLVNAAAEVTRFLQRDLGYYLGYAYIPAQEPNGGVIRIAVLEGRLDRVVLNWPEGLPVQREVVEAYLARLRPDSILQVRDVERVVFLVNDLRGITARFDVTAGSRPGTATLVVTPKADARWSAKVDADLNGSRFIGAERLGALLSINSPLGRGDGLTLTALSSINRGLGFALAGYTIPLGSDGFKLGSSVSFVDYRLDQQAIPLDMKGQALNLTVFGLYPWVRSRNLNLFVLASYDAKRYADKLAQLTTDKNVDSITVGVTGDFRDSLLTGAVNTYELNVITGNLKYGVAEQLPTDDDPHFTKGTLAFSRLQNIVNSRLLVYLAMRGQLARNNLDTTEQFRLGGPDGVRAFAPGEGTGDSGALATAELRLLPPEDWLGDYGRFAREIVLGLFVDAGRVVRRHDLSRTITDSGPNTVNLSGAGLALSWARPNDYALRASLAKRISGTPQSDPRVRDPRLYLQLTKFF
jgi:hemolysin activation/secretion protein